MILLNRKTALFLIIIIILAVIKGGQSVLTRDQKQFLLDAHNNARRVVGAPNMRAMVSSTCELY